MMYGFGDDVAPLPETLELVEGIVLDYATTLLHKARLAVRDSGTAGVSMWMQLRGEGSLLT